MPRVTLSANAKQALVQLFGKYYARDPQQVYAEWERVEQHLWGYQHQRTLKSIRKWLASEGFLLGDFATNDMQAFAQKALINALTNCAQTDCDYTFRIDDMTINDRWLLLHTTLARKDHQAKRRWMLELLPE